MTNISRAIIAINPDASFNTTNNDVDTIEWLDGTTPIAKESILAKVDELLEAEAAENAKKETDKTNAKAKLKAGEALSDDEIAALFG
tara:strand:+ start:1465 stop:1725 length:261 start_codon:yes stop_codon:yes gene_type:complete